MYAIVGAPATSFPQTSLNRDRSRLTNEIASYIGGEKAPLALDRARIALEQAIRAFNVFAWKFNRLQQTIPFVANTSDYDLNGSCRSLRRATILDANGKDNTKLNYIDWQEATTAFTDRTATSSYPDAITIRNLHETGKVTIYPPMGPTPSTAFPSMKLDYHRRIVLPTGDTSVLNVPAEVEEAIMLEAIARAIKMVRTFEEARLAQVDANKAFALLEREHLDYPEFSEVA